ncbi:MAG: transcriptional repressor [Muribaculaceae bacterium]|nr:transcriptional repressor [Muribaculaceae bacterium]
MEHIKIEEILESRGVKPTPNRILVLRELLKASTPMSLADIEQALDYSVDKASIFRVLELFADKDVVHTIEDGSRSIKYEICHSQGQHSITDQHAHFYCERCHRTYCLEHLKIPAIILPEGFSPHSVNYLIKGNCPNCK